MERSYEDQENNLAPDSPRLPTLDSLTVNNMIVNKGGSSKTAANPNWYLLKRFGGEESKFSTYRPSIHRVGFAYTDAKIEGEECSMVLMRILINKIFSRIGESSQKSHCIPDLQILLYSPSYFVFYIHYCSSEPSSLERQNYFWIYLKIDANSRLEQDCGRHEMLQCYTLYMSITFNVPTAIICDRPTVNCLIKDGTHLPTDIFSFVHFIKHKKGAFCSYTFCSAFNSVTVVNTDDFIIFFTEEYI